MQQISFATAEHQTKKRVTRREKFLAEMDQVVPWQRLVAAIEPHYPTGERGRPPIGLERMLRLYFVQQWYGLADEALEDAVSDSAAIRNFVGWGGKKRPTPRRCSSFAGCWRPTSSPSACSPKSTPT